MIQGNDTAKDAIERERMDTLLDAALAATFPASDPVAIWVEERSPPASQEQAAGASKTPSP